MADPGTRLFRQSSTQLARIVTFGYADARAEACGGSSETAEAARTAIAIAKLRVLFVIVR